MEPLEWRFGVHHAPVKGRPCNSERELSLWPLNRLACGHQTGAQIGLFWVIFLVCSFCLKPPIFLVFWGNFPSKLLILEGYFSQITDPRTEWDPQAKPPQKDTKKTLPPKPKNPRNWRRRWWIERKRNIEQQEEEERRARKQQHKWQQQPKRN